MTVAQLSNSLTHEELLGWAAFFEIKREAEDKARDQSRMAQGAKTMAKR
jgi:hypothetical protein|tara:strand:- start:180 stop:326 length:147 start_codon:yes stop_codon:yes gene_type:complete